jgi:hypothetical protein
MSFVPTKPSEYMKPEYEEPPSTTTESYTAFSIGCRQVAIEIEGVGWVPCRTYQNAAVLYFLGEKLSALKNAKKVLDQAGMTQQGPVFWTFEAPQGGTFKISHLEPTDGQPTNFYTFIRDNGSESKVCLHHGHDSMELMGVEMDKFD